MKRMWHSIKLRPRGEIASDLRVLICPLTFRPTHSMLRINLWRRRQPALKFFAQYLEVDGFGDTGVATRLKKTALFGHESVRRHGNHGDRAKFRLLSHPGSYGESVLVAKLDIQQHGLWRAVLENASG